MSDVGKPASQDNGFDVVKEKRDARKTKPPEVVTSGGIDQDKGTAIPNTLLN